MWVLDEKLIIKELGQNTARIVTILLSPLDEKEETFLKFLLPNYVPGMIIGSAGSTIGEMMDSTNTVIKFSPGRELYPGTSERICVIIGAIPDICVALNRIFSKMADPSHMRADELQESMKHFKMLVSNIAAGMVIGKLGQTIKTIQQECGVKIQISSKDESSLPERSLSILGDSESIVSAVRLVLEHTKSDPDAHKWKKLLSYNAFSGAVAQKSFSPSTPTGGGHGHGSSTSPSLGMAASAGSSIAAYGSNPAQDYSASNFMTMLQQQSYAHAALSNAANQSGASVNQALLSYAYAQSLMTSSYYGQFNPVMVDGVNLSVPGATLATFEIAVPEVMVTSVLGPGNKLITDLIQSTGARIQLSVKGDYIPGTYNRKLTIAGPILSVQSAHMILLQKIIKEQEIFRKQGLI